MKIFLFAFLLFCFSGATPQALAAESAELQCSDDLASKRHQDLISLVTLQAPLYGLEDYVCAMGELWKRGHLDDVDFFMQLPASLTLADGKENPYLRLYIYQQADRPGVDETSRTNASKDAARIYADNNSPAYNPEKAKHYYLKHHTYAFKRIGGDIDFCQEIRDKKGENAIEQNVNSELFDLCQASDENVFELAEKYEDNPIGHQITLNLYKHLKNRFFMGRSSQDQLEEKIDAKIEKLLNEDRR